MPGAPSRGRRPIRSIGNERPGGLVLSDRVLPTSATESARARALAGRQRRILERARASLGKRGQSLVEFALVLPVLLLLTLTALDFGRIYLGWINLQNMTRIAANFAANYPDAWISGHAPTIEKYRNQILSDAAVINCELTPAVPADPAFTDVDADGSATGIGDQVTVALTCEFTVITPVISSILGGVIDVSASSVFPVKSAMTATGGGTGGGSGCLAPSPAITASAVSGDAPLVVDFRDASGGGAGVSWLWDFGDGGASTNQDPGDHTYAAEGVYVVTLSVTNDCGTVTTDPGTTITVGGADPEPLCTVPDFNGVKRNAAQGAWDDALFTTTVQDGPGAPKGNGWNITEQSIVADTDVPCDSTIEVNG